MQKAPYPILQWLDSDTLVIQNQLHRATSLFQFRKKDGSRRIGMPFWICENDGEVMWFEQVTETTDVKQLLEDIHAGLIWIRTSDVQYAQEVHGEEKLAIK